MNNDTIGKTMTALGAIFKKLLRSTATVSFSFSMLLGILLYAGPSTQVSAHYLPTRHVYLFFDGFTLDLLTSRTNNMGNQLFQNGDEVGFIIKIVPRGGTGTGAGAHADFYVPNGTTVIDAAFVQPGGDTTDGLKNFDRLPMGRPSPIVEVNGGVGTTPAMTTGAGGVVGVVTDDCVNAGGTAGALMGPNVLGNCGDRVDAAGVHRGTIRGVYGDTGIFYATDPDTAYGSWQRYTASLGGVYANDADGDCGLNDGNLAPGITLSGVILSQSGGEPGVPCNKWDAEQLFAWGVQGATHINSGLGVGNCSADIHGCVTAPIADDKRGTSPWGFASGVSGPESGYAWQFDWDEYIAHRATDPAFDPLDPNGSVTPPFNDEAIRQAMDNSEIGPWNRIQYMGSRISEDTPGGISGLTADDSVDGSTVGVTFPLPSTISQTDATSTKTVRFSIGESRLEEPEFVWVKVRIDDVTAMLPAGNCPELHADTFGGDAGGPDGGKDHLWRYYEPSRADLNLCAAIAKPVNNTVVGQGSQTAYQVQAFNAGDASLFNVVIEDTLPGGVMFISSTPIAQDSGPNPLVYNVGTLNPGQSFATDILVEITTNSGVIDNQICMRYTDGPGAVDPATNPEIINCTLETIVSVTEPIMQLEKTAATGVVTPGGTLEYTLTATNIGFAETADKPATIIDMLPDGFTFTPNIVGNVLQNATATVGGVAIDVETSDVNGVPTSMPEFLVDTKIAAGDAWVLTFTVDIADPLPQPLQAEYCNSYQFYSKDITKDFTELLNTACVTLPIISGNVMEDTTGDGLGDTPISNTTVQLYTDAGGATPTGVPGTLVSETTTDVSGDYSFFSFTDANFVVVEIDPAGLSSVSDAQSVDNDVFANTNTNDNLIPVTMVGGEEDINNNFVDFHPGSLAGTVWFDEDLDGINDIEEARFTDIRVELQDGTCTPLPAGGANCPVLTTDGNGMYLFEGLYPNTYTINVLEADLPAGLTNTAGVGGVEPKSVPVAAGQNVVDVDFGYIPVVNTGAIGDRVWADANGDGIQGPGEAGIAGVTLTLLDATGTPVGGTVTTNANGDYLFTNVPFGDDYTVTINPADAQLVGFTATVGPQSEGGFVGHPVSLNGALRTVTDVDFGFDNPDTNTLSDTVFYDENSDGVINGTDKRLAGVSIDLLNATGNVVASALTDANGDVNFTGLTDGVYSLRITDTTSVLAGLTGTTLEGIARLSDSVNLTGGITDNQDSFGFVNTGLIAGTIYSDADNSFDRNGGEPGIGGVTVTLLRDIDGDTVYETTVAIVVTSDGSYSFDGLPPGDYRVVVTPPAGSNTEDPDQPLMIPGNDQADIVLALGGSSVANDFGYNNPSVNDITGTVFLDSDKDGLQDGVEGGIPTITVELVNASGVVIAVATTDANGDYAFNDLPNGDYTVRVSDAAHLLAGYDITSGLDALPVTLMGAPVSDVDFGYVKDEISGSISGEIFIDENGSADAQTVEPDLSATTVFLCFADVAPCNSGNAIATTTTDTNGEYVFAGLGAGEYEVGTDPATLPAGLTETVNPAPVKLSEGENVTDVDVGHEPDANTGLMSGIVWLDVDGDGIFDPGEAPIPNIEILIGFDNTEVSIDAADNVTVTSGPPLVGIATTGVDGNWVLSNIPIVAGTSPNDLVVVYNSNESAINFPSGLNLAQPTNLPINADSYFNQDLETDSDHVISFLDFGFEPAAVNPITTCELNGTIYSDTDRNGDYDANVDGEFQGVTLNLLKGPAGMEEIVATTVTDANGFYEFTGIFMDSDFYQIVITDLNNVLQDLNPNETLPTNKFPLIPTVPVCQMNPFDAGFQSGVSSADRAPIGNRFWFDTNGNGILEDGERGIEGITIQLWHDTDASAIPNDPTIASGAASQQPVPGIDNLVRTVTTDQNGEYNFTNLPAGQYIVVVADSLGFVEGTDGTAIPVDVGGVTDNRARPWLYALTHTGTAPNLRADFGVTGPNSLGGHVFTETEGTTPDLMFNGTNDAPVEGVPVVLLIELPDGSFQELQRTTTNATGDYSFIGLPAGNYKVQVLPDNTTIDGFGRTADPDNVPAICDSVSMPACDDMTTNAITLSGTPVTGVDFGYQKDFTTTPVTVNYFTATNAGGSVEFVWETSNEVGHVGYQIYARTAEGWQLLTPELILAEGSGGAMSTRTYRHTVYGVDAKWFTLVDVSANEKITPHGPFRLDQAYGEVIEVPPAFDWGGLDETTAPDKGRVQQSIEDRLMKARQQDDSAARR
ncbi:MAG: DUF11 domain-containing protein [Gammaproteobacteria bacterium]|nr:DUF11 domain-containing protein [Gammaproteobacteria bacterium]